MKTKLRSQKKKIPLLILLFFALSCFTGGNAAAEDDDPALETQQVSFGVVFMRLGQTRTLTATSDNFFTPMIIPVAAWGTGNLNVRISKTDTTGEVIGLMQTGFGHPPLSYTSGITPRAIETDTFMWDYGTTTIFSAILFSAEEGPFEYDVRLRFFP
jgi:hypothetical protein